MKGIIVIALGCQVGPALGLAVYYFARLRGGD